MEKRYQVFVSSTFEDLQEERKEVMQALLELDCIPAGMELFPASNEDQWSLIKKVIDDCDYYLLIIGGRYGSENEKGISYTQMEFEYAMQQGKPIISFLYKRPDDIPVGKTDKDEKKKEKLEKFKELVQKKLVKYWRNATDLGSMVSRSMIKLIKDVPAEGWVKANSAVDENSVKEIARLQKENTELREKLTAIATEAPKGTEGLAQGEDNYIIKFSFDAEDNFGNGFEYEYFFSFTWNDIFSAIAPDLIDECIEYYIRSALNDMLKGCKDRIRKIKTFSMMETLDNFKISDQSFNQIKVQLKALGLIKLSEKKHSQTDKYTYWTLTPYGEYVMTQILAVKKEI